MGSYNKLKEIMISNLLGQVKVSH